MCKSAAPDNCYNDWLTPPKKTKGASIACHLVFIEDFKRRHDNLINISRKKTLTKHENVRVKSFFYDKNTLPLEQENQGGNLTCPKSKERLNAGLKVEKKIIEDESALSGDRVRGVYIYGVRQPRNK